MRNGFYQSRKSQLEVKIRAALKGVPVPKGCRNKLRAAMIGTFRLGQFTERDWAIECIGRKGEAYAKLISLPCEEVMKRKVK